VGLGRLLPSAQHRAVGTGGTRYEAYDIGTDAHLGTYKIIGDMAPDWPASAYKNGMSIPGAWRASLLISGLLAGMPWNAFRRPAGDDPAPRLVSPTPSLLEQPAPPDTRFTTMRSMALDYLWDGNAVGLYAARDRAGWPTAIVPIPAAWVGVRRVEERDYALPVGAIEYAIGNMRLTPADLLHIKGPCEPSGLRGLGILEAHMRTLKASMDLSAEAHSIKGVPTGYLKSQNPDLKQPQADALKQAWLRSQTVRTVAVLNATTEFVPLAWNPEQAQLIEARKFSLTELENVFGLPIGWLGGATSSRTYSNIEQDAINLIKFSMSDHYTAWKEALTQCFPRGMFVEPDLDALLASDTLNRYTAYGLATGGKPWMLPSEVRGRERMAAVEGIDDATTPAPEAAPAPPADNANPANEGIPQS
jgi:HK97 family phage portal protein